MAIKIVHENLTVFCNCVEFYKNMLPKKIRLRFNQKLGAGIFFALGLRINFIEKHFCSEQKSIVRNSDQFLEVVFFSKNNVPELITKE